MFRYARISILSVLLCASVFAQSPVPPPPEMITYNATPSDTDTFTYTGEGRDELEVLLQVDFPQFDPALGTLQSVEVSGNYHNQSVLFQLTNTSATETVDSSYWRGGGSQTGFYFPGESPNEQPFFTFAIPVTLTPGQVLSEDHTATFIFLPLDLPAFARTIPSAAHANYIGTGTVTGLANWLQYSDVLSISGLTDPNDLVASGNAEGSASVSITYTYIPIPEPASLALLLFGGLALLRRR